MPKKYTYTSLAAEMGMDVRTLKRNVEKSPGLKRKLKRFASKIHPRILNLKMVKLIKKHLDV